MPVSNRRVLLRAFSARIAESLRPALMTSMAAAFGMLPLACGVGASADMLQLLAVAVIGALCISVLLSPIATPTVYLLMAKGRSQQSWRAARRGAQEGGSRLIPWVPCPPRAR
jgi:Cu/Ag efflux pump CusA